MFVQAINALERYPTPKSRQALTSTIENDNCFYSIRIDAAQRLAKVLLFAACMFFHPHMLIGSVWIYRLLFVCFVVVILSFCTVTDFSGQDKASGVKFCTVVYWQRGQGISHFGELCSPRSQKSYQTVTNGKYCLGCISLTHCKHALQMHSLWNIMWHVDLGRHVWIFGHFQRRAYL